MTVANDIIKISREFGIDARVIGRVEASEATMLTIHHNGEEYIYMK